MGRTACTEPQCLYKGDFYLFKVKQLNIFMLSQICGLFNPLNAELNPICYLLALLGAHHFLHVSRIRVNDAEYGAYVMSSRVNVDKRDSSRGTQFCS